MYFLARKSIQQSFLNKQNKQIDRILIQQILIQQSFLNKQNEQNEQNEQKIQNIQPTSSKKEKEIDFDSKLTVYLIPTKEEYKTAEIANDIWYQPHEYNLIKRQYALDISKIIQENALQGKKITTLDAMKLLSQSPNLNKPTDESQPPTTLTI